MPRPYQTFLSAIVLWCASNSFGCGAGTSAQNPDTMRGVHEDDASSDRGDSPAGVRDPGDGAPEKGETGSCVFDIDTFGDCTFSP